VDPYISVIIPVTDRIQFVSEAINSSLNQSLERTKYEILVVTNIDLPQRAMDNVKIIRSKNKWLGPKVVEGINEAKGEIICLLDDDDLYLPNKLEVVYNAFKENNGLGLFKNPVKVKIEPMTNALIQKAIRVQCIARAR